MSELDDAIARLETAVARLEAASSRAPCPTEEERVAAIAETLGERMDSALARLGRLLEREA